ncbi:MAG: hypothetical protein JKY94_10100, partial [Rhodobacteraceae bacterium]|nr:hypothetical protein [Paracoccaceae bacterium]
MSTAAPKVAIFCNTFSASFIFRQTLIAALQKEDRLSAVVSLTDDKVNVAEAVKQVQTETIRLTLPGILKTARRLRASGTEICHGFTHAGNMAALLQGVVLGLPVIMNITGMGRAFSTTSLYNTLLRVGLLGFYTLSQGMVRNIIVQNQDDARLISRTFLPWMRHKILCTNGSGIAPAFFRRVRPEIIGTAQTPIRVGFFSRALPEKGVLDFYALADRHRANKEIAFHHIGHPGAEGFASDQIEEYAKRHNLTYLPFQVDPRPWLLAMDIVVLPSHYR